MFLLNRSRCDDLHQNCLSQRRHVLCNTAHDGHEKAPVVIVGTAARTLQAATYLAQGKIWRTVGRMAETHLDLTLVYKLALAKLFFDQPIPSAGLTGSVVVARVLEEQGALP